MDFLEPLLLCSWGLLLTSATLAAILAWYIRTNWRHVATNLPPGPPRVPFPFHILVGLLSPKTGKLSTIQELTKRYGDMAYVHLGSRQLLVVSNHEIVKELLVKQADYTSGRNPVPVFNHVVHYETGGVLFSNDAVWLENRRFALKALRSMGMGKRSIEHVINEEAEMLCAEYASKLGKPFEHVPTCYNAVSNIICSISFGHRFDYADPKFKAIILDLTNFVNEDVGFLLDLPMVFFRTVVNRLSRVKGFIDEEIDRHKKNFDANDTHDLIDLFIAETRRLKDEGTSTHLDQHHFWASIFDLFGAGTETTSTTLTWSILLLIGHPEIQKRIAAEVDKVIGAGRKPAYEDREKMPFTQAFLLEVLRFRPVAPIGLPHVANRDLQANGYLIPKGTEIVMNIFAMHHEPKVWEDPEVFRPERFLSADGESVIKRPEHLPFGAGRRVCLGEQLAKMEAFLFLVNMIQRFSFKLPTGTKPDYNHRDQVQVMNPWPYKVVISER